MKYPIQRFFNPYTQFCTYWGLSIEDYVKYFIPDIERAKS